MTLTKEQIHEIAKEYNTTLFDDNDIVNALWFALDIAEAEEKATKEAEPYATNSIKRLETVHMELLSIVCDFEMMVE